MVSHGPLSRKDPFLVDNDKDVRLTTNIVRQRFKPP